MQVWRRVEEAEQADRDGDSVSNPWLTREMEPEWEADGEVAVHGHRHNKVHPWREKKTTVGVRPRLQSQTVRN